MRQAASRPQVAGELGPSMRVRSILRVLKIPELGLGRVILLVLVPRVQATCSECCLHPRKKDKHKYTYGLKIGLRTRTPFAILVRPCTSWDLFVREYVDTKAAAELSTIRPRKAPLGNNVGQIGYLCELERSV